MKKIVVLFFLLFSKLTFSQKVISQEFYEGVISNDLKVSFYLKIEEDGCPRTVASAIYKYNKNDEDNWILLDTTFSLEKEQYTFVEHYNTGVFLLKRENGKMVGIWISPDGKNQYKVNLKKVKLNKEKLDRLEGVLENEHYSAYDC